MVPAVRQLSDIEPKMVSIEFDDKQNDFQDVVVDDYTRDALLLVRRGAATTTVRS